MRRIHRDAEGFTLIELLIVLAILAVVMSAIVAALSAGIRVLESARDYNVQESDVIMALSVMERDLMNSFPTNMSPQVPDVGAEIFKADELAFYRRTVSTGENTGGQEELWRIRYYYDNIENRIMRESTPAAVEDTEKTGAEEVHLPKVRKMSFEYDVATATNAPVLQHESTNGFRQIRIRITLLETADDEVGPFTVVPPVWMSAR